MGRNHNNKEQREHIHSETLSTQLDTYFKSPKVDSIKNLITIANSNSTIFKIVDTTKFNATEDVINHLYF